MSHLCMFKLSYSFGIIFVLFLSIGFVWFLRMLRWNLLSQKTWARHKDGIQAETGGQRAEKSNSEGIYRKGDRQKNLR